MAKLWKGIVDSVDWTKKRVLVRCIEAGQSGSGEPGSLQVLSWDVLTRVTAAGGGIMFPQKLQAGQRIQADCMQNQDGCWVARTIEVVKPAEPGQQSATQQ